jgi:hypothetical protein
MWAVHIKIIKLAAQWWIMRMEAPKRTCDSIYWMLAKAASGVGL